MGRPFEDQEGSQKESLDGGENEMSNQEQTMRCSDLNTRGPPLHPFTPPPCDLSTPPPTRTPTMNDDMTIISTESRPMHCNEKSGKGNGHIRELYSPSQLTAATARTLPKAVQCREVARF